ncbi:hypothetical protein Bpfe_003267, partial [Biomphalaria pfeifferi]
QPKFRFMGCGISRFDAQEIPHTWSSRNILCQSESALARSSPTLAVRSVDFPTLHNAGHYASAAAKDWTNAKSEQLQQKRERELRKLINRQTEERTLLEARHHDELEQLILRLDLKEKLAMM